MREAVLLAALALFGLPAAAFERTEVREACAHHESLRQPFFGDLHAHTRYSFDAYTSSQRNDPRDAYRFARGGELFLPDTDGEQTVAMRLRRPLDFAAVTDHAEYLAEINLCTEDPWALAYWTPLCIMTRSDFFYVQLLAASEWVDLVAEARETGERAFLCGLPGSDCDAGQAETWGRIREAAEEYYDRSAACEFTTFVGYEYTDTPEFRNLHRNVIFRNERVTAFPISAYDTGTRNFPDLWRRLRAECIDRGDGCDVLSIPHNPNLAGGVMFPDPSTEQEATDRLFFEPVVEIVQHKASSECRFDRLAGRGVATEDELCTFEQNRTDNLASLGMLFGEMQAKAGRPVPIDAFDRRNMLRNVLKDGLALERSTGVNPFRMGFIGSTDTHNAIPGAADEDDYVGHLGRRDAGWRNVQDHYQDNPGGLAAVWAEENSRDAIFEALRRKETYATSGTRPVVRFFGGWGYDTSLCDSPDAVARGYSGGVPMGGELPVRPGAASPRFLVSAAKDSGETGTDLERIQVVKGWVDASGATRERVFDVAGRANPDAGVDPATCAVVGAGHSELCSVWEDPEFDPSNASFYYVRVLENPTCRWSTRQCIAAGVNPFADDCRERAAEATAAAELRGARGNVWGSCCLAAEDQPFLSPVIQERAWTSPVWYSP